jgi:hypothetical protein
MGQGYTNLKATLMIKTFTSDATGSDTVLAENCPYLGGVAADLRLVVQAQCPGCHGQGPCVVREAIRALADEPAPAPPAEAACACRQTTDG